jgi:hypothetical protein
MRRSTLLLGIAALAAACAAPIPVPTVAPILRPSAPAAATPTRTPIPTPAPTVRPLPTEAVVVPDPAVPPLEVDWDAAPEFPSPVLVMGGTRVRAIGESGCPSVIFEPADDPMGRAAEMQGACTMNPVLSFTKAVRTIAGSGLAFEAPKGWALGAQVVSDAAPYGPFWIIEADRLVSRTAGATALFDVRGGGWVELGRGDGFRLLTLDALAPDASGDYLVSVQAQIGQVSDEWRTLGRTYYYWVQVP